MDEAARDKRGGHGVRVGDECGVVRGRSAPCREVLALEAGDRDQEPRCPRHCRRPTRNAESVSELCPQWRMVGRTRCARHGGRSRAGALHPNYREGRFSRFAPQRMRGWLEAVAQGDVLDLTDDINVLGARIAELLEQADEGGSVDLVKRLRARLGRLFKEVEPTLSEAGFSLVAEIKQILDAAARDYSVWDDIQETFRNRIKAVESQRKRAVEGRQLVSVDEVMKAFAEMGRQLTEVAGKVLDRGKADELLTEVNRLWTREGEAGVQDETGGDAS